MENIVYIESYVPVCDVENKPLVKLPIQSYITYCIYKYCAPTQVTLKLVSVNPTLEENKVSIEIKETGLQIVNSSEVPWQVASCIYPVILYKDSVITGLCGVARHICKFKISPKNPREHEEGLLGFRKSCLQAPNEVSIWTKFCEVDIVKTVEEILCANTISVIPKNLVRFENHLKKPVRVHNVYKIARDLKKENVILVNGNKQEDVNNISKKSVKSNNERDDNKIRTTAKHRKWKSNKNKDSVIDCSIKMEDLEISHNFAEGPFFTLADLILLPSYHLLVQALGEIFETHLPVTYRWYKNIINMDELKTLLQGVDMNNKQITESLEIPDTEDVSLYKCDPKRHNPKKRLFTKEEDIENALSSLTDGMELSISNNEFDSSIDWNNVPDGANPNAGHLPDDRVNRKTQQLENLTLAVLSIAKEGDLIVDFCSGSGHLGIIIAHLLPKCTIILLENKEQSLLRARERVHEMGLKNVLFFHCNLDFFIGKFDVGVALHACGIASDLVLDKCLKANAKFVLCPCCYGSLHVTDRFVYPRSNKFASVAIDKYMCIGHAADQTHKEHPLTVRGARCMAVIDSDRARLAEEFGYKVTLSKLKPLTCTPKNNLLIGVPS